MTRWPSVTHVVETSAAIPLAPASPRAGVAAPVGAPKRPWFRRANALDARRALAGSGFAVIVSTVLFAAAMMLGFPGIQRDGLDTFGLWLTLLAMWALATTVGPTLLAWLAGIPLDRWSRSCLLYTSPSPRD